MKNYEKPSMEISAILQSESLATDPWGSFAEDLEQLLFQPDYFCPIICSTHIYMRGNSMEW